MSDIDNQLLEDIKKDKKVALKRLYDLYYTDLCRYAIKLLNNEYDAEEIVQEVFISIWERRTSLKIHSFKSYLFTAVKYKSITFLKKKIGKHKPFEEISENLKIETENSFENVSYKELTETLSKAIEQLPEKCRIVFSLSRNSDLSYSEIASNLDISVKTVENHISLALKKIRKYLEENWS